MTRQEAIREENTYVISATTRDFRAERNPRLRLRLCVSPYVDIGELGRIVIQGRPDGQSHITCEVAGDPHDPMTAQREALFKPLGLAITQQMDRAMGNTASREAEWVKPPARPAEPREEIASTLMQCETCRANVALLIYADNVIEPGGLEDHARLMYSHVAELNVPTWVIGPPSGNGSPMRQVSDMLKIWPQP